MIVDTSAIVAILKAEPDAQVFAEALASHPGAAMSAATFVETAAVIDLDQDPMLGRLLNALLSEAEIGLAAFTPEQARIARLAYRDFGRGSGHRAGLNLGDCFAYALAMDRGEPLLFKGDDFTHTDVRAALAQS